MLQLTTITPLHENILPCQQKKKARHSGGKPSLISLALIWPKGVT